jgi:uncharacterized membrane protein (DUF373 family)
MNLKNKKHDWLWHSLYLMCVGLFTIYGFIAVFYRQYNIFKWGVLSKIYATVLFVFLVLPTLTATIEKLVHHKKDNNENH